MDANRYDEMSNDCIESFGTQHRNGDRTYLYVLEAGGRYLVVAAEIDEASEPLAGELVDAALTESEAIERAKNWTENNPKGLSSDGGLTGQLFG